MALWPCHQCRQRFVGPAASYYFGLLNGATSSRWKLRLCPTCRQNTDELLTTRSILVSERQDDDGNQAEACICCLRQAEGHTAALFCTTYRPGQDRTDYFALVHDESDCLARVRTLFWE